VLKRRRMKYRKKRLKASLMKGMRRTRELKSYLSFQIQKFFEFLKYEIEESLEENLL
jgi:hypothetical protein